VPPSFLDDSAPVRRSSTPPPSSSPSSSSSTAHSFAASTASDASQQVPPISLLEHWTTNDVCQWLSSLGSHASLYIPWATTIGINGRQLLTLTSQTLPSLTDDDLVAAATASSGTPTPSTTSEQLQKEAELSRYRVLYGVDELRKSRLSFLELSQRLLHGTIPSNNRP
jgi:hypothetical protein